MDKVSAYLGAAEKIRSLTEGETDPVANMANVCAVLKAAFDYYSWCGFYIPKGEDLVLGPFQGKPACVRIGKGKGVCGKAALEKKTLIVPDISGFPGHIACDPDSRSEIVLPVTGRGELKALLDIDSDRPDAFDETDRVHLEKIAELCSLFL